MPEPYGFHLQHQRSWGGWSPDPSGVAIATYDDDGITLTSPVVRDNSIDLHGGPLVTIADMDSISPRGWNVRCLNNNGRVVVERGARAYQILVHFPSNIGSQLTPLGALQKDIEVVNPPDGWRMELRWRWTDGSATRVPCVPVRVRVRIGGAWWRVWWNEQRADYVVPLVWSVPRNSDAARCGAPAANQTNAEWAGWTWRPSPGDLSEPEFAGPGLQPGWHPVCIGGEVAPAGAEAVEWVRGGVVAEEEG